MWWIATHPDSQSCTLAPGHRYYHIQYCIMCECEVVGKIDEEELKSKDEELGHTRTYPYVLIQDITMADLQASFSSLLPFWIPECRAYRRKAKKCEEKVSTIIKKLKRDTLLLLQNEKLLQPNSITYRTQ